MDWRNIISWNRKKSKIYSDFTMINYGKTKKLVCKVNKHHPNYEKNIELIELAPEMLDSFREIFSILKKKQYESLNSREENIYNICEEIINKTL